MADDLGEKTEDATPKRRAEARQSGQVARSPDFASALLLLAMTLTLWAALMPMLDRFRIVMESVLGESTPWDPAQAWGTVTFAGAAAVSAALPVLAVAWVDPDKGFGSDGVERHGASSHRASVPVLQ